MKSFLSPTEIEAAKETIGVDRSLIDDQTYFVIETNYVDKIIMIGSTVRGNQKRFMAVICRKR